MDQTLFYNIALTRLFMVGPRSARTLIEYFGSAQAVFEADPDSLRGIGNISRYITDDGYRTEALRRAGQEMEFIEKHGIKAVSIDSENYPRRLAQCPDAPVVLYSTGNAMLQTDKMVSVVGTRRITAYGRDMTEAFVSGLAKSNPGVTIVSGLAYGVDVTAHRAALDCGLPTIGVVAHGLDTIYPSSHRNIAGRMCCTHGAVVTEYVSRTKPDPQNFVQRNRIIAGLSDVTVIVESAEKGGALITAEIANDYNRDVMAFPGRVGDQYSAGCNALIRRNKAQLITSAAELTELMGWNASPAGPVQQSVFADELPPEQQKVVELLKQEPLHINVIAQSLGLPVQHTSALLTGMVFDDIVRQLPGDCYSLIVRA
ncbi:MAG: DNA-processing protein DprA [Candidatus Aphodosoma sp.]